MTPDTFAVAAGPAADTLRMTAAAPSLPAPTRHEAVSRLIDLGLYGQALGLLQVDDPVDAALGVRLSLFAGDVASAGRFLPVLAQMPTRPGEVDLLHGCLALASGNLTALNPTEQLLARTDAQAEDFAVFAVVVSRYDLHRAGVAARPVLHLGAPLVAIAAAAEAADGDLGTAFALLESVPGNGSGEDPVRRTLALLEGHGHVGAAHALAALGAQVPGLPRERHRYWADLGAQVVPPVPWQAALKALGFVAVLLAWFFLGALALVVTVVITSLWARYVPLPGLDIENSRILRGYRSQHWKSTTKITFPDVLALLAGGLAGLIGLAVIGRNASDNSLAVLMAAGLLVGGLGATVGRRLLVRRLEERREQAARDRTRNDVRCRCLGVAHLVGPDTRPYVDRHLVSHGPVTPDGAGWLLRCNQTRSYFLHWPAVSATLRLQGLVETHPEPVSSASPYL